MRVYVVVGYDQGLIGPEICIGVLAVYSTLEKAQAWIWYQASGPITYDIEEHGVDEAPSTDLWG